MSMDQGVYLFGVIKADADFKQEKIKLDGNTTKTYTVPYKDQAMVVAQAPVKIYDPTRENLKTHQQVVAELMTYTTVIPMSFGNVLESDEDAEILIKRLYDKFKKIFPTIENKIEVGLKIIGNKDWMKEQAGNQEDLAKMKQALQDTKQSATHYDKMRAGEAAQKFVQGIHLDFEREVFRPLANIADAAKSNEVIGERMVLNASFLVDLSKEKEFDEKVNEFYEKWKDRTEFKYTGPWPAYNFIDIKIKAEDAS
ncbi:GvpL/GvpF family gas vesicle protein [Salipaludibacillus sp. CUR1]|uniref:GvpL/GvpF family gas vesicle protein n=1 Tax=Salipaludibacillus sp. CUR1 TaxID=2820003 RepID=UPI001E457EAE|nr:GvpL/GvpF family gas vesicle protein [Salipaludibacillus sp. CUR1]MCE7793265.1 GvpL/GvpF family gas vesicle protein [Salipaludibacillus sp. CUR1]